MRVPQARRRMATVAAAGVVATIAGAGVAAASNAPTPPTVYVSPSGASTNADTSCATAKYATIGGAVGAVSAGSRVEVCKGHYIEDVVVNKRLDLVGQPGAVINGGHVELNGIQITASDVTVTGFTVVSTYAEGILVGSNPTNPIDVSATNPTGIQPPYQPGLTEVVVSHDTVTHNVVEDDDWGSYQGTKTPKTVVKDPWCAAEGNDAGDCGEGIHLDGAIDSTVSYNTVGDNVGGILLSDEAGPDASNLIAHNTVFGNYGACGIVLAGHNTDAYVDGKLALDPANAKLKRAGIFGNTVEYNVSKDNGLRYPGAGAGVGIFIPQPGGANYDNLILRNTLFGNNQGGVTIHFHTSGQYSTGIRILDNTIGKNNLQGDATNNLDDRYTSGMMLFSMIKITPEISGNTITGDAYGIWTSKNITIPGKPLKTNKFVRISKKHIYIDPTTPDVPA